jgi:hypothetical protein
MRVVAFGDVAPTPAERGHRMNRRQFGFLAGVALAVIWATVGFLVMIAAVVAGLIGYVLARVLDGDIDVRETVDHLTSGRQR